MTLNDLTPGQAASLSHHQLPAELARRLAALGMREHRQIQLVRRGWLGGPLQLRIGNTEFMLRRAHGGLVHVSQD
ncbi:ferrous iron transport protein A [Andreprevotia lacus DSM 23236]|jgi:ferrous iron transport protein A|uniref:Ferrous iron transport protein A n=1 Tax=Andreprevotia lacus DSM 23236 TaxID=1121001 RepID=A0A1W1WYY8_9NEIS|nr:FeoA family protein [Andreprevotia lacus]SMC16854.1 ferrous iron transport protein A [Andreprevotia lacus DSM 23236]